MLKAAMITMNEDKTAGIRYLHRGVSEAYTIWMAVSSSYCSGLRRKTGKQTAQKMIKATVTQMTLV